MIRASGGRIFVKVRRSNTVGTGMAAYLARQLGPWKWSVPYPKGHPLPPKWETLRGRSRTMGGAVEAGLKRLAEIYGEGS